MSSSLGLDLDRYHAGLVSAISLTDLAVQEAQDWPGSWVLDDSWCVQVPVLAEELALVPDPRRRAGRRFDLVFLLLVMVMATLAGTRSIAAIRRWTLNADPAVLSALARGGRTVIPAASTFSRLLTRLDGDAVDDAFARYTAAVLAPGDPDLVDITPADLDTADTESGQEATDTHHSDPDHGQDTTDPANTAQHEPDSAVSAGLRLRPVSLDGKCVRGAAGAAGADARAPHLVSVYRQDPDG